MQVVKSHPSQEKTSRDLPDAGSAGGDHNALSRRSHSHREDFQGWTPILFASGRAANGIYYTRLEPEREATGVTRILEAFSLTVSAQSRFDLILRAFFLPSGLYVL